MHVFIIITIKVTITYLKRFDSLLINL
jgi:hypothetical protein